MRLQLSDGPAEGEGEGTRAHRRDKDRKSNVPTSTPIHYIACTNVSFGKKENV